MLLCPSTCRVWYSFSKVLCRHIGHLSSGIGGICAQPTDWKCRRLIRNVHVLQAFETLKRMSENEAQSSHPKLWKRVSDCQKYKARCIDIIKRLLDVSSGASSNPQQGHIGHIELHRRHPSDSIQPKHCGISHRHTFDTERSSAHVALTVP